jgi:hypothetical protein
MHQLILPSITDTTRCIISATGSALKWSIANNRRKRHRRLQQQTKTTTTHDTIFRTPIYFVIRQLNLNFARGEFVQWA